MGKFKKTARVIGIVVLAVVIVCEVVLLARFLYLQNKQNAEKKQLNAYLAQIKELETMKDKEGVSSLSGVNGDFVAWIKCADIGLSLPIVQARADAADFYLSHDFKKNQSIYGCPYVKSDCDLAESLTGGNSVIVGHSAFLGGVAIFSGFYDYLAPKQSFNFKINLQLLNGVAEYEIVSAFEVDGDDEDGLFIYNTTEFNGDNFAQFQSIISTKNKTGRTGHIAQSDTVLTIMTCSKHDLSKKVLVVAKKVN